MIWRYFSRDVILSLSHSKVDSSREEHCNRVVTWKIKRAHFIFHFRYSHQKVVKLCQVSKMNLSHFFNRINSYLSLTCSKRIQWKLRSASRLWSLFAGMLSVYLWTFAGMLTVYLWTWMRLHDRSHISCIYWGFQVGTVKGYPYHSVQVKHLSFSELHCILKAQRAINKSWMREQYAGALNLKFRLGMGLHGVGEVSNGGFQNQHFCKNLKSFSHVKIIDCSWMKNLFTLTQPYR